MSAKPGTLKDERFKSGMTVADLKRIVAAWPDASAVGEPCCVWVVDAGGLSYQVKGVGRLNYRTNRDRTQEWAELCLKCDAGDPDPWGSLIQQGQKVI